MSPYRFRCDLAAFLFDSSSSESFRSARSMMEAISTSAGETLPCVLLASKDDLGMAQVQPGGNGMRNHASLEREVRWSFLMLPILQDLEEEIKTACADLAVPLPVPLSVPADGAEGVLRRLVAVAVRPEGNFPFTSARRAHRKLMRQLYMFGLGAAGSVLALYLASSLYSYLTTPLSLSKEARPSSRSSRNASSKSSPPSNPSHQTGDGGGESDVWSWLTSVASESAGAVQQGWNGASAGKAVGFQS